MKPTLIAISIVLPLLAAAIPNAQAVECARGSFAQAVPVPTAPSSPDHAGQRLSERAGSGRARPFDPCATATGAHGNTATKAVAPGYTGASVAAGAAVGATATSATYAAASNN